MNKIYTLSLIALLNLCIPTICSEPSWTLKKSGQPKNWLATKCDSFAQKMVTRHTYKHNSFEHIRDMAILSILPAHISQAVLCKQRENMKNFLIKNEENALEGIKEYLGFDQPEWARIMSQAKKDREFNLSEMRKDQNFNTCHDPALPPHIVMAVKNECKRHNININSLSLMITPENHPELLKDNKIWAWTASFQPSWGMLWNSYNPAYISFNVKHRNIDQKNITNHACTHEFTHIIQGHTNLEHLILEEAAWKYFDFLFKSTREKYYASDAMQALTAAQEKTADTLIACTDPEAAKNSAHALTGYIDNHNDIRVLNTNWKTSQRIETSRNMLQSLKKKLHQATHIF
jgi:hypothetical protein